MRVNNLFYAKLDNTTQADIFYKVVKLDHNETSYQKRLDNINNILNSNNFFEEYFNNHFNCHLTTSSELSSNNNVCQTLEKMADYLLYSDEARELSKKDDVVYVFTDEYLRQKTQRESINSNENILDFQNVQVVKRPKSNKLKLKIQKITPSDLKKDTYTGKVLKDYQCLLDTIDRKIKNREGNFRKLAYVKHSVVEDMITSKDCLDGVWGYNWHTVDGFYQSKLNCFDFTDYDTVKALLSIKGDLMENENMWMIDLDLQNFLSKAHLTYEEDLVRKILNYGYKPIDITETTGVDYQRLIRSIIPNIIKKMIKLNIKYDAATVDGQIEIEKHKKLSK